MKRGYFGYGLVFFAAAVCAGQVVACSSDFSSCMASRSCSPTDTGGAGHAGDSSSGGSVGGSGGKAGASAGNAGVNGVGVAGAGGEGGVDLGGESGEAGLGGAGGEAASPVIAPALFGACSLKGEVVCQDQAGAQRLACDGLKWQAGTTCGAGQLCNSLDGQCANKVLECASAAPGAVVCRGDKLLTCGPDLVTGSEGITCGGLCKNGVCQAPVCGDKKVEAGEDCDDGSATSTGGCVKCKTATCGDGNVYAGHEQCDDKNTVPGDGCSATCKAEPVALALGGATTCALSSTGVVKCWGDNSSGALGLGDTQNRGDSADEQPSLLPPVDLGTNRRAVAISAGLHAVCALLDDGAVKCWGDNASGQLGTGDRNNRGDAPAEMGDALRAIAIGTGRATAVRIGQGHACAILDTGALKCWGSGTSGQLGQETVSDLLAPPAQPVMLGRPAKAVSVGRTGNVTCALLDDSTAKCWGDPSSLSVPSSAEMGGNHGIGNDLGEISNLAPVNIGQGHTFKSISAGAVTCGLLNDASVKCWGVGFDGQLGQVGTEDVGRTPDLLAALPSIDLGTGRTAKSIDIEYGHACALLENGELKCWGYDNFGQLGIGSTTSKGSNPGEMGDALRPVALGGPIALQVATGTFHTCAILNDGTLKCWGANESGQLGLGDTRPRGDSGGVLEANTTVSLVF